jgi:hypothetical protein
MGRIEDLRLTGTQEMVWEHGSYRLAAVRHENPYVWFIGFELGTLKLTHRGARAWQVEFTPRGGERPTRIFRTNRTGPGSQDPP